MLKLYIAIKKFKLNFCSGAYVVFFLSAERYKVLEIKLRKQCVYVYRVEEHVKNSQSRVKQIYIQI